MTKGVGAPYPLRSLLGPLFDPGPQLALPLNPAPLPPLRPTITREFAIGDDLSTFTSRCSEIRTPVTLTRIFMNSYIENGYKSRADYLKCLAEDTGVDIETVKMLADLLGPNEDFDGLVTALEDME